MSAQDRFKFVGQKFRLAQRDFGAARWWPIAVESDESLSGKGWKLAGPTRDASSLPLNEFRELVWLCSTASSDLTEDQDKRLAELLERSPFTDHIPPIDVDVNDESTEFDITKARATAHRFALAMRTELAKVGLGSPSWHTTNDRGGLHGDMLSPSGIKSTHLIRAVGALVRKAAKAAKVPVLSQLPHKKNQRPAVYVDDSIFNREADRRGVQWRLVWSRKGPDKPPKVPVDLDTLTPLERSAPVVPADTKAVQEAIAELEFSEALAPSKPRTKVVRTAASAPGTGLTPEDLELVKRGRLRRVWEDNSQSPDRSIRSWRVAFEALRLGADDDCVSRLLWNMPGRNKVIEERRDQRYVDQTIASAKRKLTAPVSDQDARTLEYALSTAADWPKTPEVWKAAAGTLMLSGFVTPGTVARFIGELSGDPTVGRNVTSQTAMLIREQTDVVNTGKLRDLVGTPAVVSFAWAMTQDLKRYSLGYVWQQLSPNRINTEANVEPLIIELQKVAAETEDKAQKKKAHHVRRRLMASTACGRRHAVGFCPLCKGRRCRIHLYCNDPSCPPCLSRRIRDYTELLQFPKWTRVYVRDGYHSKADAQKATRGMLKTKSGKRPLILYAPTSERGWSVTMFVDEADHELMSLAGSFDPEADVHAHLQPNKAMDWVIRSFLTKHAAAREAIETGGANGAEAVLDAYGKHTASTRNASIKWPTKEEIRLMRRQRALEAASKNPNLAKEECPCPEEVREEYPPKYEVQDDEGNVIASDLASPPTLAQVSAFEAGEPVRLHKPRPFRFRMSSRLAERTVPARE